MIPDSVCSETSVQLKPPDRCTHKTWAKCRMCLNEKCTDEHLRVKRRRSLDRRRRAGLPSAAASRAPRGVQHPKLTVHLNCGRIVWGRPWRRVAGGVRAPRWQAVRDALHARLIATLAPALRGRARWTATRRVQATRRAASTRRASHPSLSVAGARAGARLSPDNPPDGCDTSAALHVVGRASRSKPPPRRPKPGPRWPLHARWSKTGQEAPY
jgi:hypothetical protein